MFYSPTKEFVRFSTYRTAEINALRERIQKQKVTNEQISNTQMKLEKLRKQYEGLQKEDHFQLKDVLQNSESSILELQKQINVSEKEYASKKLQLDQLQKVRMQFQDCGSEEEEKLRWIVAQKEKLCSVYDCNQQTLLQRHSQLQLSQKQHQKQRKIRDDIFSAQAQLDKKWKELKQIQDSCHRQQQEIRGKIASQKQKQAKIQKQLELGEKQIQKFQLLKKNSQISNQFYQKSIQHMQNQQRLAAENQQAKNLQDEIGQSLSQILQNMAEQSARVQKEQLAYQRKIKEVLMRVSEQEEVKCKVEQKIAIVRANLKLFKQKNESLKGKMNAIFKNDAELMKTIANKKVYPHIKGEVVDTVKKSVVHPLQSKENQASMGKHKPQLQIQTRLLGQTNRIL